MTLKIEPPLDLGRKIQRFLFHKLRLLDNWKSSFMMLKKIMQYYVSITYNYLIFLYNSVCSGNKYCSSGILHQCSGLADMKSWLYAWNPHGMTAGSSTNQSIICWYAPNSPTCDRISSKSIFLAHTKKMTPLATGKAVSSQMKISVVYVSLIQFPPIK